MSFCRNLRDKMNERGITQTELAQLIGKGKSSISQYVSGANIPREDVQKKLAEVLQCTVDDLLAEDEIPVVSNNRNVSVAEAARRLGKSQSFVRGALQAGTCPFGFAVRNKSVYSYHISSKKLDEYIGR